MTKTHFPRTLAAAIAVFATISSPASASPLHGTRPNIVLIMPDDISFGGIGAYGGTKPTPHLDKLYHQSLRFENYQVSPTCAPTRAALMTGRHECYAGVTHTVKLRDRMKLESRTVADMLKASGYATGIFDQAIRWIVDQKDKTPFFCFIPTNVNHTPRT